jgi:hypothetical protein
MASTERAITRLKTFTSISGAQARGAYTIAAPRPDVQYIFRNNVDTDLA